MTNIEIHQTSQLVTHAQNMAAAKQLADALCATDMVPAHYKGKPANGAAAILYGDELGLNPIQSLQNIFIVQGKPAIYARTAKAICIRAGVRFETVEKTDERVTIRAERDGQAPVESTWDIARATKAEYTKNPKYKTNPQEMLASKATMEVCREIASDVLLGIAYSTEELQLENGHGPVRVESSRVSVDDIVKRAEIPAQKPISETPEADDADIELESATEELELGV